MSIEEYNKIGDPEEVIKHNNISETMTRRKHATLNEIKQVQKIDKEKLVKKK